MRSALSSTVFAPIAILLSTTLTGCGSPDTEKKVAAPLPVQTFALHGASTMASERYPATIMRDREANLSFRVPGTVAQLRVRIGQTVQAGQVLARLIDTPYVTTRIKAQAEAARLERQVRRNDALLEAGAVAESNSEDSVSALEAAGAAVDAALYDEASTRLRAPFSGTILARDVEVGESVAPGQRVLRIADNSSLLLARAAVPAAVAGKLRTGAPATLVIGPEGREIKVQVLRIGALSNPRTATVDVDLSLPKHSQLPSGLIVSARFDSGTKPQADSEQRLPPEALLSASDGWAMVYLYEPTQQIARRTRVKLLGFDGEWLRVQGLPPGARVITAGAGFVADGQKVREVTP